jgi:hypothetical protein
MLLEPTSYGVGRGRGLTNGLFSWGGMFCRFRRRVGGEGDRLVVHCDRFDRESGPENAGPGSWRGILSLV